MTVEIGFTDELCNTHFAPVAALFCHYRQTKRLKPLTDVGLKMKTREFSAHDKLEQVLVSSLCGCKRFSDINTTLKHEHSLAQACGWQRFADQSNLSRTLDELTQMNIEELKDFGIDIGKAKEDIDKIRLEDEVLV